MNSIYVGTSGYSYKEWVGSFYPQQTKNEEYLSYYANQFPTVELNFSYYRMPEHQQLVKMAEQASHLLFSIKAHQSLTHTVKTDQWRSEAVIFQKAVAALAQKGCLGAILLQFPYSFHYEVEQRLYLGNLIGALNGFPLAVEFRNAQWYNNRTLDELRKREVTLVSLDLPLLKNSPPIVDVLTSSVAYIRLHGRNEQSWWNSDTASRYDYFYSAQELQRIAARINSLAVNAKKVFIYFNNHRNAQAALNAQSLKELLKD
ncbi:MAG: DUF72 domain-containing protein [Sphaerochaetaceae bacterium]|jgi:uncharacterized protein YecE (DUF72 family)